MRADDITVEVFEVEQWDMLTETVPTQEAKLVRLLHKDGTYIRVKLDGYPARGAERCNAAVWRSHEEAERFNRAWGSPFRIEREI